jgi:PST family polysaccharide transporter
MALVSVPCGLLQAALSAPGIHILFAAKWYPAIPVLQALSIGMTFMMIGAPAGTLLQAQGRFKTLFYIATGSAVGFVALVWAATSLGGALAMGLAVAVFYALYGAAGFYATVRPAGGSWRDVLQIYGPSLAAGIVAVGSADALSRLVPATGMAGWLIRAAIVVSVATPAYLLLARRLAPQDWANLVARVGALFPARRRDTRLRS